MKKYVLVFCVLCAVNSAWSQIGTIIPQDRRVDWTKAGYQGAIPDETDFDVIYDVTSLPGYVEGQDVSLAIQNIIDVANPNLLTMIFFPPGNYLCTERLNLINKGNIVFRGSGHYHTQIEFKNISGSCFNVVGNEEAAVSQVNSGAVKGSQDIHLNSTYPGSLSVGDFILIEQENYSQQEWNIGDCVPGNSQGFNPNHRIGQMLKVSSVTNGGTTLSFEEEISFNFDDSKDIWIKKVNPVQRVGIENLKIFKSNQSGNHNVNMEFTANCWIRGVESYYSNIYHFNVRFSSHVQVEGCFIHEAYDYSQCYGIYFGQYFTSFCLAENNIIDHVRHSVVISYGASNNVIGYNYGVRSRLASDAQTSDFLLHGYYPSCNLFEGNVADKLHSDQYWGKQGEFNTFFRNKFTSLSSLDIWASDFSNSYGNWNVNGHSLTNPNNECVELATLGFLNACNHPFNQCMSYSDISYYKTSKPDFLHDYTWPLIGPPVNSGQNSSNTNTAEIRFQSGGQECYYKRSDMVGYSVENNGLLSAFNRTNSPRGIIMTNENRLSVGYESLYEENVSAQFIDEITTIIIEESGELKEEILFVVNSNDGARIYRTFDETAPTEIHFEQGSKITAIASGNFDSDPQDELIWATLDQHDKPHIYKAQGLSNLTQQEIYTSNLVYWNVDALACGDFDGTGDDELIIGFNSNANESAIYHSVSAEVLDYKIWENLNGYWDVVALAAGDFNEDGEDELIQGFNSTDGPAIYKVEDGLFMSPENIYYYNTSLPGAWSLGALAAGDFDSDGDDELVSAFNSLNGKGPAIYKSEKAENATSVRIYKKEDNAWEVSALAVEKCNFELENGVCVIPGEIIQEDPRRNVEGNVPNPDLGFDFNIYPNPTNGSFIVQVEGNQNNNAELTVYDQLGKVVIMDKMTQDSKVVDLKEYKPGVYFVTLTSQDYTLTRRLIKN